MDRMNAAIAHVSWLHVALQMGVAVETCWDAAEGVLSALSEGMQALTELILNPKITFTASQEAMPSPAGTPAAPGRSDDSRQTIHDRISGQFVTSVATLF
jgi:hypothetical protein